MMSRKLYDYLGIVAMIATPLAAAILFGWELYDYLDTKAVLLQLAIIGGIAGAIAIESVGIFAGHTLMNYIKRRDWRAIIPALAMMFYVYFGYSKVPEYGIVFVLAGFVYVLVALESEAVAADESEASEKKADVNWQRRMELEDKRMRHAEKLARIDAKKAQPPQQVVNSTSTTATVDELTPAQLRVYEAIKAQPTATYAEIGETLGISRQAVSKHAKNLNGLVKEAN